VGERCNVAGSSIYKKAIVDGNWDKALSIAALQVRAPWQADTRLQHQGQAKCKGVGAGRRPLPQTGSCSLW
jgi:hypothetical protein